MTDYERHSLQLLSMVANGLALHLSAMNPTMMDYQRQELEEDVLNWQKNLHSVVGTVKDLIKSDNEARNTAQG